MGLFSKLFNDPRSGEEALDFLKNAAREVMNEAASKMNDAQPASRREPATPVAPTRPASGFSWGGEMPAEENQFSFAGSYVQYFEMIFREDFPAYRVDTQAADADRFTVFTLWDGGRQALLRNNGDRSDRGTLSACFGSKIDQIRAHDPTADRGGAGPGSERRSAASQHRGRRY